MIQENILLLSDKLRKPVTRSRSLLSRIEREYCLIGTSYLRTVCVLLAFLPMRTLCDTYHNEFESH